ncbi:MAG TPA: outer membrane beta-barrel protein, partial [Puia sp.]|nr:outer membrane beta-barrel protein [Puia sp.]
MKALAILLLSIPLFQHTAAQAPVPSTASSKSPATVRPTATGKPQATDTAPAKTDTQRLKDVVVRGKKPLFQQQTGGMVVNLESSLLAKGSSALEVLERSPGVIIDHRNNSIALNGKSGITVMINGKLMQMSEEQLLTMLNDMRADNIEKIELLDAPPARYDAEGSAGVINIVLKKMNTPGTNANLSITGGYGWGEKAAGSISLDHNTGKTGIYGSYSFSHDRGYGLLIGQGDENVPVFGGPVSFDFRGETRPVSTSHNAVLGLDTRLTPSATVGASVNYSNSPAVAISDNLTRYKFPSDSLLSFDGQIKRRNRWTNLVSSVYLEKKIGEGQQLNAGMDWLYYKNNDPSEIQSSFLDQHGAPAGTSKDSLFSPRQKGFANTTIQVGVARIDYTRRLAKKIKLETGLKGNYTVSSSHSGIESLVNGGWITSLG